jgi:hypothetical protein
VFFDEEQKLTHVGSSFASEQASYALPTL